MIYTKINKTQAKKRIEEGKQVICCPSKCHPNSIFAGIVSRLEAPDFEKWENSYMYYNCNNTTGNKITYYVAD